MIAYTLHSTSVVRFASGGGPAAVTAPPDAWNLLVRWFPRAGDACSNAAGCAVPPSVAAFYAFAALAVPLSVTLVAVARGSDRRWLSRDADTAETAVQGTVQSRRGDYRVGRTLFASQPSTGLDDAVLSALYSNPNCEFEVFVDLPADDPDGETARYVVRVDVYGDDPADARKQVVAVRALFDAHTDLDLQVGPVLR